MWSCIALEALAIFLLMFAPQEHSDKGVHENKQSKRREEEHLLKL